MNNIFETEAYLDVVREIGNIGAGNAATALSKLVNERIDMKIPKVQLMPIQEVGELLGMEENQVIGIIMELEGDLEGMIMFIINEKPAKYISNRLFNKDDDSPIEYDDMTISLLSEVGNIMAGNYVNALAHLAGIKLNIGPPIFAHDMAGAILSVPAIEMAKTSDKVLYIESKFESLGHISDSTIGDFFLIPDMDMYTELIRKLGV